MSTGNRRFGIALDGNQLSILVINQLAAAYATIGTDRARDFGSLVLGPQVACALGHSLRAGAVRASSNLLDQWPTGKQIIEHSLPPCTSPIRESKRQMILAGGALLPGRGEQTGSGAVWPVIANRPSLAIEGLGAPRERLALFASREIPHWARIPNANCGTIHKPS